MPQGRRNADMLRMAGADLMGYGATARPMGELAIANGSFELGRHPSQPDGWFDGWEVYPGANTIERQTGGQAGDWCAYGDGGYMESVNYLPVSEGSEYALAMWVNGDVDVSFACYQADHTHISDELLESVSTLVWESKSWNIGSSSHAFPANTRYMRIRLDFTDASVDAVTLSSSGLSWNAAAGVGGMIPYSYFFTGTYAVTSSVHSAIPSPGPHIEFTLPDDDIYQIIAVASIEYRDRTNARTSVLQCSVWRDTFWAFDKGIMEQGAAAADFRHQVHISDQEVLSGAAGNHDITFMWANTQAATDTVEILNGLYYAYMFKVVV